MYIMLISFIVPYRNREVHLKVFIMELRKYSIKNNLNIEIIIVSQNDNEPFLRGQLLNTGVTYANGSIVVCHDIDYIPKNDVIYWDGLSEVFLPVKKAEFILMDGQARTENDIPSGYRHFKDGVDENFFGAVTTITKEAFMRVNGFPSNLRGWGVEDAIFRHRCEHHGLTIRRGNGEFKVLPHKDSFPGPQDQNFRENQEHERQWKDELELGVKTTFPVVSFDTILEKKWNVDKWINATDFMATTPQYAPFMTIENMAHFYEDHPEKHKQIWTIFKAIVNAMPELKNHRDFIVQNQLGYGNRAFHWMWNLLVREAPQNFKFLEIGVYKGAIISLISLLNKKYGKHGTVYGVTPLTNVDDEFSKHDPHSNYELCIQQLYAHHGLDASDLQLIVGLSQDDTSLQISSENGPYDFVYIDGCHSNPVVRQDFTNYKEMVKLNGYLIADDASNDLNIPRGLIRLDWFGLPPVTQAVKDILDTDSNFKMIFAVGHNKVYKRIS